MGILSKLKKVDGANGADNDVLGGSRLFDTGLVDFKIEAAFIQSTDAGSQSFNIHLLDPITKKVFKAQEWIVSKKGSNTYERNGEVNYLPGWITTNSICQLTIDKELHELDEDDDIEMKTVNLWDSTAKKELPTEVPMIAEMVGKEITIGVLRVIVDKTAKGDDGLYHPTGETREENQIGKVFHQETGFTVQELLAGATPGEDTPEFRTKWAEKFTETIDKSTKDVKAPKSAAAKAPAANKKSLFGKK